MQVLNNPNVHMEKLVQLTKSTVEKWYGGLTYKGVEISKIAQIFTFWILLKKPSTTQSLIEPSKKNIKQSKRQILKTLFALSIFPVNFFVGLKDYFQWLLTYSEKNTIKNADILICISHKKQIPYTQSIANALKSNGYTVEFFYWPTVERPKAYSKTKKGMPNFWTRAYLFSGLTCKFIDYAYHTLKHVKPQTVIVIEGDSHEQHIFGRLKHVFNYQCICLQWAYEPRSVLRIGYRDMPYDAFLSWGGFFTKAYREKNQTLTFLNVGHHMLEKNPQIPKSSKAILFAVQRPVEPFISAKDIDAFIEYAYKIADAFPNEAFILRSHPGYPIGDATKEKCPNNIEWHGQNSLHDSLTAASICITISSSVGLEALPYGAYPLFVKFNQLPLLIYDDLKKQGLSKHVISPEKAKTLIPQLLNHQEDLNSISKHFFHALGPDALANILSAIDKINRK